MTKTIAKTTIKTAGVTFENRQVMLGKLRSRLPETTLILKRLKNAETPTIMVVAHVPGWKPFYVGQVPGKTAYWLAPKMEAAEKAAKKNGTTPNKEFTVRAINPTIVGGKHGLNYGLHFELLYEVTPKAETVAA